MSGGNGMDRVGRVQEAPGVQSERLGVVVIHVHTKINVKYQLLQKLKWKRTDTTDCDTLPTKHAVAGR